eukprot:TRINITY_DN2983_c0_g1_i18.p1 TRINITY_DN2983_c0_g1~~TRINITY_DN2983_c0_g1_i18.p1  ORF type:complete len:326 (+),score=36.80 TRINITY_DN2983_c0_g1_i18:1307-2284(+)
MPRCPRFPKRCTSKLRVAGRGTGGRVADATGSIERVGDGRLCLTTVQSEWHRVANALTTTKAVVVGRLCELKELDLLVLQEAGTKSPPSIPGYELRYAPRATGMTKGGLAIYLRLDVGLTWTEEPTPAAADPSEMEVQRLRVFPSTLQEIEGYAFGGGNKIEQLVLRGGGEGGVPGRIRIGASAFRDSPLRRLTIEEGVTELQGAYGFGELRSLESLVMPTTLTYVGGRMFSESGLRSVEVPAGVELSYGVFDDSVQLECMTLGAGVTLYRGALCDQCSMLRAVSGYDGGSWGTVFKNSPCSNGCPTTVGAGCPAPPPLPVCLPL